jgi:hypothetical protein
MNAGMHFHGNIISIVFVDPWSSYCYLRIVSCSALSFTAWFCCCIRLTRKSLLLVILESKQCSVESITCTWKLGCGFPRRKSGHAAIAGSHLAAICSCFERPIQRYASGAIDHKMAAKVHFVHYWRSFRFNKVVSYGRFLTLYTATLVSFVVMLGFLGRDKTRH